MPAHMTPLATGIPAVYRDQGPTIPDGFVLQLAHELPPTNIMNGLRQRRMLRQRFHCQTLDADRLVFTNQAGRELVGEITATISNAGMNTGMDAGDCTARFVTVFRAALLLRHASLGGGQLFCILGKEARIANLLANIEHDHIMQPQVNTYLSRRDGQRRDVFFQQDAHEIASGGIKAEGGQRCSIWQWTRPMDVQGSVHLSQRQRALRRLPPEGATGVGGGLRHMFFVEGRVPRASGEEGTECGFQMA